MPCLTVISVSTCYYRMPENGVGGGDGLNELGQLEPQAYDMNLLYPFLSQESPTYTWNNHSPMVPRIHPSQPEVQSFTTPIVESPPMKNTMKIQSYETANYSPDPSSNPSPNPTIPRAAATPVTSPDLQTTEFHSLSAELSTLQKASAQDRHFEKSRQFRCDRTCGDAYCTKAYISKDNLRRHCMPMEKKMVWCLYCGQIRSKQNIARHWKSCKPAQTVRTFGA